MDQTQTLVTAFTALSGLVIVAAASLRGWQGWLALKGRELELALNHGHPREIEGGAGFLAGRIELADLRERVRRLEAIAAGVDL